MKYILLYIFLSCFKAKNLESSIGTGWNDMKGRGLRAAFEIVSILFHRPLSYRTKYICIDLLPCTLIVNMIYQATQIGLYTWIHIENCYHYSASFRRKFPPNAFLLFLFFIVLRFFLFAREHFPSAPSTALHLHSHTLCMQNSTPSAMACELSYIICIYN